MWIWYLSQSDGGNVAAIVAQAHAAGVSTVFVKSSDGSTNYWSQFSPELVAAAARRTGLHVCAWQYVYGTNPAGEADLGAKAVADRRGLPGDRRRGRVRRPLRRGPDLHRRSARRRSDPHYPLGLASFPYVYYHTSFPYSVFLGPNGAQFNAPQMYWKDIGNSVDTVYANTYIANRIYGARSYPLGQTYSHPSSRRTGALPRGGGRLRRDRHLLVGLAGNPRRGWTALAAPLGAADERDPEPRLHRTGQGSRGDPVLWMQEHLASAIPGQATTGIFDASTDRQPRAVPVRPRDRSERQDRSGDMAGAAGAAARRRQLDRRGTTGVSGGECRQ